MDMPEVISKFVILAETSDAIGYELSCELKILEMLSALIIQSLSPVDLDNYLPEKMERGAVRGLNVALPLSQPFTMSDTAMSFKDKLFSSDPDERAWAEEAFKPSIDLRGSSGPTLRRHFERYMRKLANEKSTRTAKLWRWEWKKILFLYTDGRDVRQYINLGPHLIIIPRKITILADPTTIHVHIYLATDPVTDYLTWRGLLTAPASRLRIQVWSIQEKGESFND